MARELTKRQRAALVAVREAVLNDAQPTLADLAEGMGLPRASSVVGHVRALERRGLLPIGKLMPASGGPGAVVQRLAEWLNGSANARRQVPKELQAAVRELTEGTQYEVAGE